MNATTQVATARKVSIRCASRQHYGCRLTKDRGPGSPTEEGVLVLVAGVLEDSEEHKSSRDRRVQNAKEDQSWDHEGKGDLLIDVLKRAEGRCSHVLVAGVNVNDGSDEAKDDDFGNGTGPKCLWEISAAFVSIEEENTASKSPIPWFLHLRNEARQSDLADESVANVEECTHARDESGPSNRYGCPEWVTSDSLLTSRSGVGGPGIVAGWVRLDSCEDGG